MDSNMREMLESEVVYDRHVVTYKWLASRFDLHTNTAKGHLKEFTNEQEADGANVTGHSVVTGKQDKVYRVILTVNQSVSEVRKDLTAVTGVHSFSAQPSNLEDSVDRLIEAATCLVDPKVCPIYCEAAQRIRGSGKSVNGVPTAAERKSVTAAKTLQPTQEPKPPPNQPVKAEKDKPVPSEPKPPPNQPVKAEKDKHVSSKQKVATKGKSKESNSLVAAFSKTRTPGGSASSKLAAGPDKKSGDQGKQTTKTASSSPTSKGAKRKSADDSPDGETTRRKSVGKSPSKGGESPEKKRVKTEEPASPEASIARKKPSRRKVISDSEDEDEDTPQPTPTPADSEKSPSSGQSSSGPAVKGAKVSASSSSDTAANGSQKKRRRVMKSVKKTFKDEEGFLVTKLVKELVSESDDDEEDPLPKAAREKATQDKSAGGKKRAAAAADKKQQSLLSFFGKK